MHAGFLSDQREGDFSVEIFKENKDFKCSAESTIGCTNNGIQSRKKKFSTGFRFVDSASACNYYEEKIEPIPFFLK